MTNSKATEVNSAFQPQRRLKSPCHRQSLVERVGLQVRSLLNLKNLNPKILFLGAVATCLTFGGTQYVLTQVGDQAKARQPKATTDNSSETITQSVSLHTAQISTVEQSISLVGTVIPQNLLKVTPAVEGLQILEMRFQPGDRVEAGEVLAVLDSSLLQAQRQQAEADLAQARADIQQQTANLNQAKIQQQSAITDVSRYNKLYEQGAISQEQLDSLQIKAATNGEAVQVAMANLNSAHARIASKSAAIDSVQTQIEKTLVTAPTAGTIAERLMTVGDAANAGTPLYSLIEDSQLALMVTPAQDQLASIQPGTPVVMSTADARTIEGSVYAIDPLLDSDNRRASVKVTLPGAYEENLQSGMSLTADLITGSRRSVVVPAAAVIARPDGTSVVYTLNDLNRDSNDSNPQVKANVVEVAARPTSLNAQSAQVEILSGLTAGSQVVVGGASYLQTGDRVRIVPGADANANSDANS